MSTTFAPLNLNEAIRAAKAAARTYLVEDAKLDTLRLEEIDRSEDSKTWYITLSYSPKVEASVAEGSGESGYGDPEMSRFWAMHHVQELRDLAKRVFKRFEIDAATGQFVRMVHRDI